MKFLPRYATKLINKQDEEVGEFRVDHVAPHLLGISIED